MHMQQALVKMGQKFIDSHLLLERSKIETGLGLSKQKKVTFIQTGLLTRPAFGAEK